MACYETSFHSQAIKLAIKAITELLHTLLKDVIRNLLFECISKGS